MKPDYGGDGFINVDAVPIGANQFRNGGRTVPIKALSGGSTYYPPSDLSLRIGEGHCANKYQIEVFVPQLLVKLKDFRALVWKRGVAKTAPPKDRNVF